MLAREASEKDILESRKRLRERQNQRILERDTKQAIEIVNRHSKIIRDDETHGVDGQR